MDEAREIARLLALSGADWEREYGLHSNIPECCVEFFVRTWRTWWRLGMTELINEYRAMHKAGRNYVPCRACAASGMRRKLHRCGDDCVFQKALRIMTGGRRRSNEGRR